MKNIWIFGKGETSYARYYDWLESDGEVFVKYFRAARFEANPNILEGYNRPDVIVNLHQPSESLLARQRMCGVLNDAQFINLY